MDKFFNLFKNKKDENTPDKEKNNSSDKDKEKKDSNKIPEKINTKDLNPKKEKEIITTQNLENFANITTEDNIKEKDKENISIIEEKEKESKTNSKVIGDVVTVNTYEDFKKNTKGFYSNKYKEKLESLNAVKFLSNA